MSKWAGWVRETELRRRRTATATRGMRRSWLRTDPATTKGVMELATTKAMAGKPPWDRSGSAATDERARNLCNEHLGPGPVAKREQ
jgi:hypothetical protein